MPATIDGGDSPAEATGGELGLSERREEVSTQDRYCHFKYQDRRREAVFFRICQEPE